VLVGDRCGVERAVREVSEGKGGGEMMSKQMIAERS
jgi:hypothetical protein